MRDKSHWNVLVKIDSLVLTGLRQDKDSKYNILALAPCILIGFSQNWRLYKHDFGRRVIIEIDYPKIGTLSKSYIYIYISSNIFCSYKFVFANIKKQKIIKIIIGQQ